MAIRKIIQVGDPRLKGTNKGVVSVNNPKVKKVIKDLKDTMKEVGLIGIAAPQIGENYKIFVTQPRKTKVRKLPFKDIVRVYINPHLVKTSKEEIIIWEGCGCVGTHEFFFGPVRRPKEVTIEALNEAGKRFQIRCNGILARVIQHEYDHLKGIEFLQKVDDYKKIMHEKYYTKTIRNSKEQNEAAKVSVLEIKNL